MIDDEGLAAVWLFPTLGVLYEELLKDDPEAVGIVFRAFNRWLDEDWGFAYRDRIFAAPYISLADVGWAVGVAVPTARGSASSRRAAGRPTTRSSWHRCCAPCRASRTRSTTATATPGSRSPT